MIKPFIISYVIYPFNLMICFEKDYKKIRSILKKRLPKNVHNEIESFNITCQRGRTVIFSSGQTVINFISKPSPGTISHEVFHAVEFLMRRLSIKLCLKNDEAYAYLIGYITEEIYKKLKNKNG